MKVLKFITVLTFCIVTLATQIVYCIDNKWQVFSSGAPTGIYKTPIYSNQNNIFATSTKMPQITQCVLVQHGAARDGINYLNLTKALLSRNNLNNTLLFIPQFFSDDDRNKHGNALDNILVWQGNHWIKGADSDRSNGLPIVSSFQVFDDLLLWLLKNKSRFPNLKKIVIAGHSGGGQFVHRYAAINNLHKRVIESGSTLNYVVANPASYMYFSYDRPSRSRTLSSVITFTPLPKSQYRDDHYKYGTSRLELLPYVSVRQIDLSGLFERYISRDVSYFFGSLDNEPSYVEDHSEAANKQGHTHLERGKNYVFYERFLAEKKQLGDKLIQHRQAYIVEGGHHDEGQMLGSECAMKIIFDAQDKQGFTCHAF